MLLQSSNHLGFVERGPHPRRIRVHSTLSGPHLKPLLNATTEPNGCDAQDTSRTCPNSQIPSQNEASEGCILLVQKEQRNKPPLLKSNLLILNPINSATQFNSCTIHGEGNGTPLQDSCLENPMDGGAWWAAVHGVSKSRTRLSDFTFTSHFHALEKEMATHSSALAWRIPGTGEPGGLPSMG